VANGGAGKDESVFNSKRGKKSHSQRVFPALRSDRKINMGSNKLKGEEGGWNSRKLLPLRELPSQGGEVDQPSAPSFADTDQKDGRAGAESPGETRARQCNRCRRGGRATVKGSQMSLDREGRRGVPQLTLISLGQRLQ